MTYFVVIILIFVELSSAQRGGRLGGRRAGRRYYSGVQPTIIQHRSPSAVDYYDHKDVSHSINH